MKFYYLLLILLPIFKINAQVVSGRSDAKKFVLQPEYILSTPPNLYVDMKFADENGNGILEAEESSTLTLEIINKGVGPAQGLIVKVIPDKFDPYLTIGKEAFIREIKPNTSQKVIIPINAGFKISSNELKFQISVTEHFGYDMDAAYLLLNTLEFQKPQLYFSGMEIFDAGAGTGAIVADGQLQAGELVKVKIVVQNIGNNEAKDVKYSITATDPNIFIMEGEGNIGVMNIGETKEVWFNISPNKRVTTQDKLPVFMSMTESKNTGNLTGIQLPILLNQRPPKTNIIDVKPDLEKIKKQVARFEYKSEKYTSNITAKNVEAVPVGKQLRENAVAVVIGVEQYKNIPSAPYAARDAEIMAKYFKDALGINKVFLHTNSEVSGFFFDEIFDPITGLLNRSVKKGETDVFVYYSGHGIPQKDGDDVFLFPSDGKLEMADKQGYSVNKLYESLNALGAKSVTVIIDACFSGSSRTSDRYMAENISNTKGVIIKPIRNRPWINNNEFRVFTSSENDQTSLGFDASETGLFTYFIALGLQGEADEDQNHIITVGELRRYVGKNVSETSVKIRGLQTPQYFGTDEMILMEY